MITDKDENIKQNETIHSEEFSSNITVSSITTNSLNGEKEPHLEESAGVYNSEVYAKYYSSPTRRSIVFLCLFFICYAYGLDNKLRSPYQTLATSSYKQHSLLSTVNAIKSVISAAGQIWFARASDLFGRGTILIVAVMFYVVGTIVESQAVDVSKFAAGACLFQLGYDGVVMMVQILVSDFSNLNWRVTAVAFPVLPNVINTWVSGDIASAVDENWKWGIGMWAFIFPLSCIPFGILLLHMKYLARKNNDTLKSSFDKPEDITWKQYLTEIFLWKLDFIGLLLAVAFFGLVLVPFTLAGGLNKKWKTARIIVPEVLGWVVAFPAFLTWEIKFAKYPLTPWKTVKDRGVFSALIIAIFLQTAFYMQKTYMYTILLVAVNQTKKSATRINSLFTFVTALSGTLLGLVIVKVRRTKEFIFFGIAVWFLSFGLLERYTGGTNAYAGIIAALCLLGFGNGFIKYPTKASMQASALTHEMMAIITSLFMAISTIGTSVGSSVAGAIWTNVLPDKIEKGLNNSTLANFAYNSPTKFILQYNWESPERQIVVNAYKHVEKILIIVGLCFLVPLLGGAFLLRNQRLEDAVALDKVEPKNEKKEMEV
ncbi:hypothetical protein Kpol_416p6 [Vanderwaltozyma polyspora DSM 70294]|uniref:Major facilitator superfamily (MFS) profile domain-containing protein n=1 Tax=Vanderwaltozyma polyspora (strain ATCC 22028 / DSM 70294 / BCRC 21397 / CBS 2163 / NBRC 10782 / NRRL Y-8283 / UCD 57-17) TaxID=436907 RepID=A7TRL8_VANPO|nr:uncharacterized protein Kpol_416p6 [Vanderwaltozyma polyspora DSM 70294]EDO15091.1 hypothetical protein Kpol_416p6 [Vanderwaltozyma polyspora DSM 70294]